MSDVVQNRVAERRKALGLSQAALAARIGISRQALSALENAQSTPSGPLLLALARALAQPVEALFWLADGRARTVLAEWGGHRSAAASPAARPRTGERVTLAWLRGRWVAHPLTDPRVPAAGTVLDPAPSSDGTLRVEVAVFDGDLAPWRDQHLVAIGCDPAMALLGAHVSRHAPALRVTWLDAPSGSALDAVADGLAHIAGIHLHDRRTDAFNVPFVADRLAAALVVNLASWTQGLAVAPGNPLAIARGRDLGRPELRIVQRPAGAGAQRLLEHWVAADGARLPSDVPRIARNHRGVAEAIAMGAADVGVVPEGVAVAHGLDFVPLEDERFDLVIPGALVAHPVVRQMLERAASPVFRRELAAIGGYDTPDTGKVVARLGVDAGGEP